MLVEKLCEHKCLEFKFVIKLCGLDVSCKLTYGKLISCVISFIFLWVQSHVFNFYEIKRYAGCV